MVFGDFGECEQWKDFWIGPQPNRRRVAEMYQNAVE